MRVERVGGGRLTRSGGSESTARYGSRAAGSSNREGFAVAAGGWTGVLRARSTWKATTPSSSSASP